MDLENFLFCAALAALLGITTGVILFGMSQEACWDNYALPCSSIPNVDHDNYELFLEKAPSLLQDRKR